MEPLGNWFLRNVKTLRIWNKEQQSYDLYKLSCTVL